VYDIGCFFKEKVLIYISIKDDDDVYIYDMMMVYDCVSLCHYLFSWNLRPKQLKV